MNDNETNVNKTAAAPDAPAAVADLSATPPPGKVDITAQAAEKLQEAATEEVDQIFGGSPTTSSAQASAASGEAASGTAAAGAATAAQASTAAAASAQETAAQTATPASTAAAQPQQPVSEAAYCAIAGSCPNYVKADPPTPGQAQAQERSPNDEPVMDVLPTESVTGKTKVLIQATKIVRSFKLGKTETLEVLHGIDLKVYEGEFVAIVGASGSGKSTFMNILGALDRPTSGDVVLDGVDLEKASDDRLSEIRAQEIGFVFQAYNLIGRTTALENVELPMMYDKTPVSKRKARAMEMLKLVGMDDRADHMPNELSGGQCQRIAIARAMANDPKIIFADEPTGALDSKTGHLVMDIFHTLHEQKGKTILFITHSPALAEECERVVTIKDGMVISDRKGLGRNSGRQY